MEKYIFDERYGLWYELQGDYYLPQLKLPKGENVHIGIWGQRHLNYLRQNKRVLLSGLQLSGKLRGYLADIDKQVEKMYEMLVKQMAESESVTEQLKADTPLISFMLPFCWKISGCGCCLLAPKIPAHDASLCGVEYLSR